jgi:hypothetical protein
LPDDDNLVRAAPGLARIAAGAYVRTAQFAAEQGLRLGSRVLRAAVSGETAAEMLNDIGDEARRSARRLLGVIDEEAQAASVDGNGAPPAEPPGGTTDALRARGSELLSQSADVAYEEDAHPAYARILDELAPDEARILRFLRTEGAQPAVDVRTAKVPLISSELVAPVRTSTAGCAPSVRRKLKLHALVNPYAHARGQIGPQARVLALHRAIHELVQVALRRRDDVLCDQLRLQLLVWKSIQTPLQFVT